MARKLTNFYCSKHGKFRGREWNGHRRHCQARALTKEKYETLVKKNAPRLAASKVRYCKQHGPMRSAQWKDHAKKCNAGEVSKAKYLDIHLPLPERRRASKSSKKKTGTPKSRTRIIPVRPVTPVRRLASNSVDAKGVDAHFTAIRKALSDTVAEIAALEQQREDIDRKIDELRDLKGRIADGLTSLGN